MSAVFTAWSSLVRPPSVLDIMRPASRRICTRCCRSVSYSTVMGRPRRDVAEGEGPAMVRPRDVLNIHGRVLAVSRRRRQDRDTETAAIDVEGWRDRVDQYGAQWSGEGIEDAQHDAVRNTDRELRLGHA